MTDHFDDTVMAVAQRVLKLPSERVREIWLDRLDDFAAGPILHGVANALGRNAEIVFQDMPQKGRIDDGTLSGLQKLSPYSAAARQALAEGTFLIEFPSLASIASSYRLNRYIPSGFSEPYHKPISTLRVVTVTMLTATAIAALLTLFVLADPRSAYVGNERSFVPIFLSEGLPGILFLAVLYHAATLVAAGLHLMRRSRAAKRQ